MNYSVQGYYVFGYLMISHEALSLAQILTSNRCFDNYRFWIVDLETHVPWELHFNEFCTFSTSVQTSKAVVTWCIFIFPSTQPLKVKSYHSLLVQVYQPCLLLDCLLQ